MITLKSSSLLGCLAGCALPLVTCLPAQAVVVSVLGSYYDVTFTSTSYDANTSAFNTPSAGKMPWWGNSTLASVFAAQVYNQLGDGYTTGYGPIFAYQYTSSPSNQVFGIVQNTNDINDQLDLDASAPLSAATTYTYASAAAPVPTPLPILGATAAMAWTGRLRGLSRRLRNRI